MAKKDDRDSLLRPPKRWLGGWGSRPSIISRCGTRHRGCGTGARADAGCLIFSRFRGPDAGRGRDTSPHGRDALTRAFAWIGGLSLTSRIPGTRSRAQRTQSPDAGRGADAER